MDCTFATPPGVALAKAWENPVSGGLSLLLGIVIFYGLSIGAVLLQWLGYLAVIGGILLLAYAFVLYRGHGTAAPV